MCRVLPHVVSCSSGRQITLGRKKRMVRSSRLTQPFFYLFRNIIRQGSEQCRAMQIIPSELCVADEYMKRLTPRYAVCEKSVGLLNCKAMQFFAINIQQTILPFPALPARK